MASTPTTSDSDWAEHVRTYHSFLLLLKITAASTAVVLLGLFLFLAR
ncbi:aa3-type cytochrome c oxidase subunit IV [Methylocystis sp. 9N]|uniref:Aa3-type cytochrome c oxidase subunit IV n=1 Tax=Methylocystis borbori TaxID=3118750 RepID=A0ABU7XK75_9HYPH